MKTLPLPARFAIGLAAGLVGTIVMTLGQRIEMKITEREPSLLPAEGFEAATGIDVQDEDREAALSSAVHWSYGIALGTGLALIDEVPEPARTPLFFALVWGTGMATLQALDLDGKPTEWDTQAATIDFTHHAVYAVAAGAAYAAARQIAARAAR